MNLYVEFLIQSLPFFMFLLIFNYGVMIDATFYNPVRSFAKTSTGSLPVTNLISF